MSEAFGLDIGGSAIKAASVDVSTGELTSTRQTVATPDPSTPEALVGVVHRLVAERGWTGPVGATFPAVIKHGIARTAANVDRSWIGTDVDGLFTRATNCPVTVLNDADAAGLAELRFGAARDAPGDVVVILTLGTGIGSALFVGGKLVPNTELGHLELAGRDAEKDAAASVKDRQHLTWSEWVPRVQRYLSHLEMLFTPDLFVLGGGVSKESDQWVPLLDLRTPVRPAELLNDAGIVGAALAAAQQCGG
ncbi:MAG TPA: ROK family protein [Mycobacteriales bacterium]|nr:ROK family protein [Mycobacteriales bacterium]